MGAHHRRMKKVDGKKPSLPMDAIAELLNKQGVLPSIMFDIAI